MKNFASIFACILAKIGAKLFYFSLKQMKYIYYINTQNMQAEKSAPPQFTDREQTALHTALNQMYNSETVVIFGDYVCKIIKSTQKYIVFEILKDNAQIGLFSCCLHSRRAPPAWQAVGGVGEPPKPPFCAAKWNAQIDEYVEILINFQKAISWIWLWSVKND